MGVSTARDIAIRITNQMVPILCLGVSLVIIGRLMPQRMPGFIVDDQTLSYPIEKQVLCY